MNWMDIILIILLIIGGFMGWRMGLVKAIVNIVAIIVGFNVSAQLSRPIADALSNSVSSASVASVLAYVIIGIVVFIAAQIVGTIITKFLKIIFLGWLNGLGGLALGLLAGFLAGIVVLAFMAQLAFPSAGSSLNNSATAMTRESIKNALVDSSMVPAYLKIYDKAKGKFLGITAGHFDKALQELDQAISQKG